MSVLKYMAEQKAKIRARHCGEEFFFQSEREKNAPVQLESFRPASAILRDIDNMKGLNTLERQLFNRTVKCAKSAKSFFAV